jgi:hypothetical protein
MLRRVRQRHGLRQQLPDRALDREPEGPGVLVLRLRRLLGDVLRRVGTAPADELISTANKGLQLFINKVVGPPASKESL